MLWADLINQQKNGKMKIQGKISRYIWTKYKDVSVAVGIGSGAKSKKKGRTDMLWADLINQKKWQNENSREYF